MTAHHVRSGAAPNAAGILLLRVEDLEDLAAEAAVVKEWADGVDLDAEVEVRNCIDVILLRVTEWLETNGRNEESH